MPRARNSEAAAVFIPGQLSYLPKRREGDLSSLLGSEIPDGCFDHPVVILSTDQGKREAVVLILTSLRGRRLDDYSSVPRIRAFHLPIHPTPVHPDNDILLYLDHDLELPKKTYVNTKTQRLISWALLQPEYREQRTRNPLRLRPDSFTKLLEYIHFEAPVGHGKPKAPNTSLNVAVDYSHTQHLLESMRADRLAQYDAINRPPVPPPRASKPPRYSIQAPQAVSTVQSVARSHQGVTAEVDSYLPLRRESRRQEASSILPVYHPSPRSDVVVSSCDARSTLRRLFVILFVTVGIFLAIAWWKCQLTVCK